jgi:hypothetical protein
VGGKLRFDRLDLDIDARHASARDDFFTFPARTFFPAQDLFEFSNFHIFALSFFGAVRTQRRD